MSNGGGDCTDLLQLIEELCRQSDKLMEDARKEKEDLQQQVNSKFDQQTVHRLHVFLLYRIGMLYTRKLWCTAY